MPIDASIPMSGLLLPSPAESDLQNLKVQGAEKANSLQDQMLAEKKIDVQNAQRAQDAQKTLSTLLKTHTTHGADGAVNTDWDSVVGGLRASGYGPEALKMDTERQTALHAALQSHAAQITMHGQIAQQLGSLAGSVGTVNQAETDPMKLQQDKNSWAARATYAVNEGAKRGLISPQEAAMLNQQLSNGGWHPELENQFKQFADAALTSQQNSANHLTQLRDQNAFLSGQATRAHLGAETAQIQRGQLGGELAAAAESGDIPRYREIYLEAQKKDPTSVRGIPAPEVVTKSSAEAIRKSVMPATAQENAVQRSEQMTNTQANQKANLGVRNAELGIQRQRLAAEYPMNTANGMETAVHGGVTYQRKAGSTDQWTRVGK